MVTIKNRMFVLNYTGFTKNVLTPDLHLFMFSDFVANVTFNIEL